MSLSEPEPDGQPEVQRDGQREVDPAVDPAVPTEPREEAVIGTITGTLHRAPRYTNFMSLGTENKFCLIKCSMKYLVMLAFDIIWVSHFLHVH